MEKSRAKKNQKKYQKVPLGTKEIVATDFNPLEKNRTKNKYQKDPLGTREIVATDFNPLEKSRMEKIKKITKKLRKERKKL